MRKADETAPLLSQSSSLLDVVPEEGDDGGERDVPAILPSSRLHRKSRRGVLVGGGLRRVSFARTHVLPLHALRTNRGSEQPVWKTILAAIAAVLLLIFIISSTLLLDSVKHPTGPFPAPPFPPPKLPPRERNPAFLIKARNGAVATENEVCSNIGVNVLRDGGNAVDAAIASTFCIGVVSMFSSVSS